MRATTERPIRIGGALLTIAVMSIVAAGLKIAELLERHPDSHCPACGRTRSTCDCWEHGGVLFDGPPFDGPLFDVRACRVCGCTDDRACPGGCWWVAEDVCSECETRAS